MPSQNTFNLGDKVELVIDYPDGNKFLLKGHTGTIIGMSNLFDWCVEWNTKNPRNNKYIEWHVRNCEITLITPLSTKELKKIKELRVLAKIKLLDTRYKEHMKSKQKKENKCRLV